MEKKQFFFVFSLELSKSASLIRERYDCVDIIPRASPAISIGNFA